MSATFGARIPGGATGASVPADCFLKSSSLKESVEVFTHEDANGITVRAVPSKMVTKELTLELIGKAPLAVAAGSFAAGTFRQTNAKISEAGTEFPSSSLTYKAYSNAA